jgi:hypothetical protein
VTIQVSDGLAAAFTGFAWIVSPTYTARVAPGDDQTALINLFYNGLLQARVFDSAGRPAGRGIAVQFTAPGGGASATFASPTGGPGGSQVTIFTDANGVATAPPLLANAVAGRFSVSAQVQNILPRLKIFLRIGEDRPNRVRAA